MEIFVALPLFFIIGGAALAFAYYQNKNRSEAWSRIARELGLDHRRVGNWMIGTISGDYKGLPVLIETYTRSSGKNKTTYTRIRTDLRVGVPWGLKVYDETPVFSSIGKLFGGQDIQTGDAEFDDQFIIKGDDEPAVLGLLNHTVRNALLTYRREVGPVLLDSQSLTYETRGVLTDTFSIRSVVESQNRTVLCIRAEHANKLLKD